MAQAQIQWDATPDTSGLQPAAQASAAQSTAQPAAQPSQPAGIQWDATPDTSALTSTKTSGTTPNGMPANTMQAVPSEQTPEGNAAAITQREAQHPIITGLGRAAGDVWSAVKGMVTPAGLEAPVGQAAQGLLHIKETIPMLQAYETARASGKGIIDSVGAANAVAGKINDARTALAQKVDDFKKHPTQETTRAVADAAALAATMWSGEQLGAGVVGPQEAAIEAQTAEANAAIGRAGAQVTYVYNPETGNIELKQPSLLQKISKGEQAAQPAVQHAIGENAAPVIRPSKTVDQSAMQDAAYRFNPEEGGFRSARRVGNIADETNSTIDNYSRGLEPETNAAKTQSQLDYYKMGGKPLLKGDKTILDDHISSLQNVEDAAYKKVDDAAGFDIKAEKKALANDQYKLKQLGNTDADKAQRIKLEGEDGNGGSINDSKTRLADAETKLKAAGLESDYPDYIHKMKMAAGDIKKALINNVSSDGQTVNTSGFLNAAKKLRFTKYGDRLAQFLGSPEQADQFMSDLEQAQKLGKNAQSWQETANFMKKYILPPAGLAGIGYEAYRKMTQQ